MINHFPSPLLIPWVPLNTLPAPIGEWTPPYHISTSLLLKPDGRRIFGDDFKRCSFVFENGQLCTYLALPGKAFCASHIGDDDGSKCTGADLDRQGEVRVRS